MMHFLLLFSFSLLSLSLSICFFLSLGRPFLTFLLTKLRIKNSFKMNPAAHKHVVLFHFFSFFFVCDFRFDKLSRQSHSHTQAQPYAEEFPHFSSLFHIQIVRMTTAWLTSFASNILYEFFHSTNKCFGRFLHKSQKCY